MSLVGTLVGYALTVFLVLLIARMVVDWIDALGNGPQWARKARR